MQVILLQSVPKVGKRGELKKVKDGYFRNFLYPKNLAVASTPGRVRVAEGRMKKMMIEHEEMKKKAIEVKERLENLKLTFEKKASAKGKLFGSVSQKAIADLIKSEAGVDMLESQILLKDHLKSVGIAVVPVQVQEGVVAEVKVEIKAQA